MKDEVYKAMRKVKFNDTLNRFYNEVGKELKKYVSDDVIYSHTYWNENDMLTENIHNVKDIIIDSVIRNKYKKVYKI